MPHRAIQGGRVTVESSNKAWSTGGGNGKLLQYSCRENPMNSMKRQKDMTLECEPPPRLVSVQYATGEEQRNSSRKDVEAGSKQKRCSVVDESGGKSKVRCCKEQHCIGTWNFRSMNQGKLDMVKQEIATVNINILEISELKWIGMGKFNSDDHYIYYCGQEWSSPPSQQESEMQYLGAISKITE